MLFDIVMVEYFTKTTNTIEMLSKIREDFIIWLWMYILAKCHSVTNCIMKYNYWEFILFNVAGFLYYIFSITNLGMYLLYNVLIISLLIPKVYS